MAKKRLDITDLVGDIKKPIEFKEQPTAAPEPAGEPAPDPEQPAAKKGGRRKLSEDKKKGSRLSVYLTAEVYAQLAKIAEKNDDSLNKVASKAIALYCQKMCPEEDTPENNEE